MTPPLTQDYWNICDILQKKSKAPARGRGVAGEEEEAPTKSGHLT
jgi:hypothetical protein